MTSETNGLDEANNVTPSEASKNKIFNLINHTPKEGVHCNNSLNIFLTN